MVYPKGERLVQYILDAIKEDCDFGVIAKSNPLCIEYAGKRFVLFFKCISYAGNPYPRNTTRAQLPQRKEFTQLASGDIFLFIGYDCDNDVYVTWDPTKTKARLNKKGYVSFFSRQSEQNGVKVGHISSAFLSNGDKYVLFKREDVHQFFESISALFPSLEPTVDEVLPSISPEEDTSILNAIENDISVKLLVDTLMDKHRNDKLYIISECMKNYGGYYEKMRFIDWAKIVQKYVDLYIGEE